MDIPTLQAMLGKRDRDTAYFVDVRTHQEYEQGTHPRLRWFPGGQVVQRSDVLVVTLPGRLCLRQKARATFIASWYRQFGFVEVYVVQGGTTAWAAAGLALEHGMVEPTPFGLAQAREHVQFLSPQALQASQPPLVLYVDTSQDFGPSMCLNASLGRGWLECQIGDLVPPRIPIAVTSHDGRRLPWPAPPCKSWAISTSRCWRGACRWQRAGPGRRGPVGVMRLNRRGAFGPDRTYAEMMHYLRWETVWENMPHTRSNTPVTSRSTARLSSVFRWLFRLPILAQHQQHGRRVQHGYDARGRRSA